MSWQEFVNMLFFPKASQRDPGMKATPLAWAGGGIDRAFFTIDETAASATAVLLDNDGYRNIPLSTNSDSALDVRKVQEVNGASIDLKSGHVVMQLPVDSYIPQFRSNDNLVPLVNVATQLPIYRNESESRRPTSISAKLFFAGFESQVHTFDVSSLEELLQEFPDRFLTLSLVLNQAYVC
ncbi:MAG: hypothetical protein ABL888_22620 [Pirellulaceae bacterium]